MWSDKKGPIGPQKGPIGPDFKKGPIGPDFKKGPIGPDFEKGSVRPEKSTAGPSYPRNRLNSTIFSTTFQLKTRF